MSRVFNGYPGSPSIQRLQGALLPGGPDGGIPVPITITLWISPLGFPPAPAVFHFVAGRPGLNVPAGDFLLTGLGVPAFYTSVFGGIRYTISMFNHGSGQAYAYSQYRRTPSVSSRFDISLWDFYAMTFVSGDGGPRTWSGDLTTPVTERSYAFRSAGSGSPGKNPPLAEVNGDGLLVNGTANYLGQWCIGGPQESFIVANNLVNSVSPYHGRIAHVTHWAGVLNSTQLENIRTLSPYLRRALPAQGYPDLLGDWWLDEDRTATLYKDHSPYGRHLGIGVGSSDVLASFDPRIPTPSAKRVSALRTGPGIRNTVEIAADLTQGAVVGISQAGKLVLADYRASKGPVTARGLKISNAQPVDPREGVKIEPIGAYAESGRLKIVETVDEAQLFATSGEPLFTPGVNYWLGAEGEIRDTKPATVAGDIDQYIGYAVSGTEMVFDIGDAEVKV